MKTLMEFIKENIGLDRLNDGLKEYKNFLQPLLESGSLSSEGWTYLPNIATDEGVFGIIATKGELSVDIEACYQHPFYKNKPKSVIQHTSFESLEKVYDLVIKEDRPLEYTADSMRRLLGFQEFRNSCRIIHYMSITALKEYQVRTRTI